MGLPTENIDERAWSFPRRVQFWRLGRESSGRFWGIRLQRPAVRASSPRPTRVAGRGIGAGRIQTGPRLATLTMSGKRSVRSMRVPTA